MKILHVGASGLVGGFVLSQLLTDPRIEQVIAPTRKALAIRHARLDNPVVDFERLPSADAALWRADAVICTLGTTMKQAGSRARFRRVDHDYTLQIARNALQGGAYAFALNSALGADPASRFFYNRVKGELERDLQQLPYPSMTFVRPGLIGGRRAQFRASEQAFAAALKLVGPLLPPRWRINPAAHIAAALVDSATQAMPGRHVVDAAELA
ncbi:MAG: NAD-dependent dehydratase [Pseudoxanthomonas sp.]